MTRNPTRAVIHYQTASVIPATTGATHLQQTGDLKHKLGKQKSNKTCDCKHWEQTFYNIHQIFVLSQLCWNRFIYPNSSLIYKMSHQSRLQVHATNSYAEKCKVHHFSEV